MDRKYALFDWDNTVREGYTLYSWVDYLCNHSIINNEIQKKLQKLANQYQKNEITHDEYADKACREYTEALTGKNDKIFDKIIKDYIKEDRKAVFPEVSALMKFLNKRDIDIVVISGAPTRILEQYKKEFGLEKIFGFEEEVVEKKFTGKVACNFGHHKERKVKELIEYYKKVPYLALGDSESDLPLLKNSDYPICVGNRLKKEEFGNMYSKDTINEIIKIIK